MSDEAISMCVPDASGSYRRYGEARAVVRAKGFKSIREYKRWAKSKERPQDIPHSPKRHYNGKWKGWNDWLGTAVTFHEEATANTRSSDGMTKTNGKPKRRDEGGVLQPNVRWEQNECHTNIECDTHKKRLGDGSRYLPFLEAREYARSLGLKSIREWKEFLRSGQRPKKIPSHPDEIYAGKGWIGWRDWLGYSFLPFIEARSFARSLGLKSQDEWEVFARSSRRPREIPFSPSAVYAGKGWMGWMNWLGNEFLPFNEARVVARSLGLETIEDWNACVRSGRRPKGMPASPDKTYANKGWIGWRDWLGTEWLPFPKARTVARSIGLKSYREWEVFAKSGQRPRTIPANPNKVYKGQGWRGFQDWLGYVLIRGKPYRTECDDDAVPGSDDDETNRSDTTICDDE